MFGFSPLTVVFEDNIDNYFARTRVLERLSFLQTLLSRKASPRNCGPDATGLGWVFQYYLKVDPSLSSAGGQEAPSGGFDLGTLRSLRSLPACRG
jgi:copper/silver efflux system protein